MTPPASPIDRHATPAAVRVIVDGDACPVKQEVLKVSARHGVPVVIVSNGGLRPSRDPRVRHVIVPRTPDAADDWIVDCVAAGDVVVTADVLLAARCIAGGARVLGPNGRQFTEASIGMSVAVRNLNETLRDTGEIRGANSAFSGRDRSRFLESLDLAVRRARRPGRLE